MTAVEGLGSRILLQDGDLWPAVRSTVRSALASGALRPWQVGLEVIEERRIRFQVRILRSRTDRKSGEASEPGRSADRSAPDGFEASSASSRKAGKDDESDRDPFLPWESELFVADISDSHVALLNKYPVVDDHLLIVTRAFEEQERPLTRRDWEALWICLEQGEALAFYNSGAVAGASQRHRHLQLVPLPLAAGEPAIPIEASLATGETGESIASLPFPHFFGRFDPAASRVGRLEASEALYRQALRGRGDRERPAPYNLLVTRRWLLFVPRVRAGLDGIPVNALGFAGALLARDAAALERLRELGPSAVLAAVAGDGLGTDR